ncbi:Aste57867_16086 [Aphanomyces stellatus]|uniref:Aste57867_16086 protein n=1 Tax=Aphanomyces stellatus TaxID=120398 RepID=A0A485L5M2_9STRA|nr:hypothetical protein As57867_016030 [Aphanomyces stellatus]VFT92869.1 Aste57867_16086 [Aphanomyces stellatus]
MTTRLTTDVHHRPPPSSSDDMSIAWANLDGQHWWPVLACRGSFKSVSVQVYVFGLHTWLYIRAKEMHRWKGQYHYYYAHGQTSLHHHDALVKEFIKAMCEVEDFTAIMHGLTTAAAPCLAPTRDKRSDSTTTIAVVSGSQPPMVGDIVLSVVEQPYTSWQPPFHALPTTPTRLYDIAFHTPVGHLPQSNDAQALACPDTTTPHRKQTPLKIETIDLSVDECDERDDVKAASPSSSATWSETSSVASDDKSSRDAKPSPSPTTTTDASQPDDSRTCPFLGCLNPLPSKRSKFCRDHAGRCSVLGCPKNSQVRGLCAAHGGVRYCKVDGCNLRAAARGVCKEHGGVRCLVDGCSKLGDTGRGLCHDHDRGQRHVDGCFRRDRGNGRCVDHNDSDDKRPSSMYL